MESTSDPGAPQDRPDPTPLTHAARLLAKSLPDEVVESIRWGWGNTNVEVIKHWRDETLRLLADVAVPARAHHEEKDEMPDDLARSETTEIRDRQPAAATDAGSQKDSAGTEES